VAASLTVVIPVRAAGRGMPAKNLRVVAGRPLLDWTVEAALGAASVAWVVVSTDDPAVMAHLSGRQSWRDRVFPHRWSAGSAPDGVVTDDVLLEFLGSPLGRVASDVALVQATNPLLRADDIEGAYRLYRSGYDSVLTVVRQRRFLWAHDHSGAYSPDYLPERRPRRRDFAGHLVENGALYITGRNRLAGERARISGRIGLYEMPPETYTEVEGPDDLDIVESLLRRRFVAGLDTDELPLRDIRMVLTGVDGVLTDNGMTYHSDGSESKTYSARDSKGFEELRRAGILTGLVTSERGPQIRARASKIKADILIMGSVNKLDEVRRICRERSMSLAEVAYVGDDAYDRELLANVGFAACPADAMTAAADVVHHQTRSAGGHGAFREVADLILSAQGELTPGNATAYTLADQAAGYV
jgi:YrbI family 3-deoxy-D-manno-octulosonate 8-phosphate phosphatase